LRGEFQIEHVEEGTYIVVVDSPGVLKPLSLLDMREFGPGREPELSGLLKDSDSVTVNGTSDAVLKVHARRGGTISGKVTYGDGDPAVNCLVGVSRKIGGRYSRTLIGNTGSGTFGVFTDERGIYRITSLPPGDYVINATELNTRNPSGWTIGGGIDLAGIKEALSFTYYPSERSPKSATEINLGPGQEIKDIDITLLDQGERTVSGSVISSGDRLPVKNATIGIRLSDKSSSVDMGEPGVRTGTDDLGQWTLADIPDGVYTITVIPGSEPETPQPVEGSTGTTNGEYHPQRFIKKFANKTQRLTVAGGDVTGVVVELGKSAKITGKVSVEGGKKLPAPLFVKAQGGTGGDELSAFEAYMNGRVDENGNFEIGGITPGQHSIDVNFQSQSGWHVKRITVGGKDVKGVPVTIVEGQQITGVEVVISSDSAIATVRVVDALKNSAVSGVPVCMVPSDPAMWGYTNGYLCGISDGVGTFQISGAPGTYLALVPGPGESRNIITPEYVKLHAAAAQSFVLKAGAENQVQLSVSR
jgi:hypothetical protein